MPDTSKTIVAFRTYFWDSGVDAMFAQLRRSTSAEIVIVVDETHGPLAVPDGVRKISHTLDTFVAMGLPLYPSEALVLWHCGDYVLSQLLDELEFDHLLLLEGDCTVAGPLDSVLARLIADGADLAGSVHTTKLYPPSRQAATLRWFGGDPLHKVLFNPLFVSRRAIELLRPQRLAKAATTAPQDWVFCEGFVPTAVERAGFVRRDFEDYADFTRNTWNKVMKPDAVHDPGDGVVRFFHPVLASPHFERKAFPAVKREAREAWAMNKKLRAEVKSLEAQNRRLRRLLRFWRPGNWPDYARLLLRRLFGRRRRS